MSSKVLHENGELTLQVEVESSKVIISFLGKSRDRQPAQFLLPFFDEIFTKNPDKMLVIDFSKLEYLNSSTITPIVKQIDRCRKENRKLEILYKKDLKWQELSFSALKVFLVPGLIEIKGI